MSKIMQSVLNLLNRANTWLQTQAFSIITVGGSNAEVLTVGVPGGGNSYFYNFTTFDGGGQVLINGKWCTNNGGTAPTSVAVGASPFTFTNNSTSQNVLIYIGGGVVTAIAINGVTVVSGVTLTTLTPLYLKYNDYVTITYTTAPTVYVMNA